MLNLNSIKVDQTMAREGVWMEYMGGRFLVARKGQGYDNRLVELYREHHDLIKSGTPEGQLKAVDIYRQCFAEHILLDWDEVGDENGPITYTPEIGMLLTKDPGQIELVQAIERFSAMHSNYQAVVEQDIAEDVKSSADS